MTPDQLTGSVASHGQWFHNLIEFSFSTVLLLESKVSSHERLNGKRS